MSGPAELPVLIDWLSPVEVFLDLAYIAFAIFVLFLAGFAVLAVVNIFRYWLASWERRTYIDDPRDTDPRNPGLAMPKPSPTEPSDWPGWPGGGADVAAAEHVGFGKVLDELGIDEEELRRLVSEGQIRSYRDEDKMKYRAADIEALRDALPRLEEDDE